jgi:hypothetical protein
MKMRRADRRPLSNLSPRLSARPSPIRCYGTCWLSYLLCDAAPDGVLLLTCPVSNEKNWIRGTTARRFLLSNSSGNTREHGAAQQVKHAAAAATQTNSIPRNRARNASSVSSSSVPISTTVTVSADQPNCKTLAWPPAVGNMRVSSHLQSRAVNRTPMCDPNCRRYCKSDTNGGKPCPGLSRGAIGIHLHRVASFILYM